MDQSEPSESRFVHRSQIASIGHICCTWEPDNSNYDGNNIEVSQKLNGFQLEKNIEKEGNTCREILKQLATI